ncbi:MAG: hypothetical protein HOM21_11070, partial [Halobacteriovoraceae bacterium]|nr:hypothetical protein [Halobacteriovoraceae bacterium]
DKYKNIIVVGEANVATTGAGRGGRCSHFVASMAAELLQRGNLPDFQLAAVATDGVDGYSGSAGAFASSQQLACDLKGLRASLAQFNSGEYLNDRGLTLRKAATGINLMDFYLLSSMD